MDEEVPKDGFEGLLDEASIAEDDAFLLGEESAASETPKISLLEFRGDYQRYALRGEQVREVISGLPVTRLPGAPTYIEGIVIHRRQVIGLINLGRWFGFKEEADEVATGEMDRIILVEHGSLVAGIACSQATSLESWPASLLDETVPDSLPRQLRAYTLALRDADADAGGPIILLDIKRLLDDAALQG